MIDRRWLPLNALRAFEAVGKHLSFTAGAQALHVTQSALSRHVASLEVLLECKLVERKPHGLILTPAGAALLPTISKSFDRLQDTMNEILRDGSGLVRTLRVHMPPSFLQHMAIPMLRDFRREFPNIPVDVSSSPVTGVPSRDLDIAVIYDRPRQGDAIRDLLWTVRVTPLCSPELARDSEGLDLAAFLAANELLHVRLDGQPRGFLWDAFAAQAGIGLNTERGLAFDTASLAVQYALSGASVVLADIHMFADLIASGQLVQPYDTVCEDGYGYYLTFHPEDVTEPGIALFRAWMIERFTGPAKSGAHPVKDL
ncbi:LysR substrate-binding domain-containing protein [Methylobacterium organophilum]|uniref:LysR substrate-binding domain-containing protein n=1 Tax=Methylobacterium organophilum TaxID=410 RepID=UPI001F13C502|nr:LysR substrate-binding domain-containing protein [Methylobacterium organophilum]UMY16762.1 LysR substrate-binding domain-containing protein [Methylobacterium organophilum]